MKKLLAIIVLGLLWSGSAYAETIESSDKHIWVYLPKGISKTEAFSSKRIQYAKEHCTKLKKNTYSFSMGSYHDYDRLAFGRHQFRFICAKTKNEAIKNYKFVANNFPKGSVYNVNLQGVEPILEHIVLSHIEFKEPKIAKKTKKQEPKKKKTNSFWNFNKKKKTVQASSSNEDPKITKAKKACRDLGFKPRSERFTDCALKLVMLDFERTTTVKNEPQVIINKNVSDTNIFDELGVLFRQQGIIQDTSRPANTRNNIRCTSTTTAFGQVVTNCR
jgi:hypothetical protein